MSRLPQSKIFAMVVALAAVTMNPSEMAVEIAPYATEIHGVNTLMQGDKVIAVERFIDAFVLQGGVWKALSAQETST